MPGKMGGAINPVATRHYNDTTGGMPPLNITMMITMMITMLTTMEGVEGGGL